MPSVAPQEHTEFVNTVEQLFDAARMLIKGGQEKGRCKVQIVYCGDDREESGRIDRVKRRIAQTIRPDMSGREALSKLDELYAQYKHQTESLTGKDLLSLRHRARIARGERTTLESPAQVSQLAEMLRRGEILQPANVSLSTRNVAVKLAIVQELNDLTLPPTHIEDGCVVEQRVRVLAHVNAEHLIKKKEYSDRVFGWLKRATDAVIKTGSKLGIFFKGENPNHFNEAARQLDALHPRKAEESKKPAALAKPVASPFEYRWPSR